MACVGSDFANAARSYGGSADLIVRGLNPNAGSFDGAYQFSLPQQDPIAQANVRINVVAGDTLDAYVEMRNVGTKPWDNNTLLGTTEPRDRTSVFAGPEWPGKNRYARVEGVVQPGESFKFAFTVHAPLEVGVYDEHFGLVQEGVTWFNDPGQGGPPDTQLEGLFEVLPNPNAATGGAGGMGAGTGGAGGSGAAETGGAAGSTGDGGNGGKSSGQIRIESACSMHAGESGSSTWIVALLAGIGIFVRRRRS